jgi:DnaJ domain
MSREQQNTFPTPSERMRIAQMLTYLTEFAPNPIMVARFEYYDLNFYSNDEAKVMSIVSIHPYSIFNLSAIETAIELLSLLTPESSSYAPTGQEVLPNQSGISADPISLPQPILSPYLGMDYKVTLTFKEDSQNDIDYKELDFKEDPDDEIVCPVLGQLFTNPTRLKNNKNLGAVELSALLYCYQKELSHPLNRQRFTISDLISDEKLAEKAKQFLEKARACKVLGVSLKASNAEIQKAFKEKAKQVHPDKQGIASSPQWAKLLSAYQTLIDPKKITIESVVPAIKYQTVPLDSPTPSSQSGIFSTTATNHPTSKEITSYCCL